MPESELASAIAAATGRATTVVPEPYRFGFNPITGRSGQLHRPLDDLDRHEIFVLPVDRRAVATSS